MKKLIITLILMMSLCMTSFAKEKVLKVKMQTTKGDVVIELYPDKAPVTVENFVKYVEDGFFDETIFHRVISGFVIQGGGFDADFNKKETRESIKNEADNGLLNDRGTISMARTMMPHSASSQFFINLEDNQALNHYMPSGQGWGYAVFGKVVEGMDVVDKIAETATGTRYGMQDVPLENMVIIRAGMIKSEQ